MSDNYRERQSELLQLGFIDQSEAYEIDENGIYYDVDAPEGLQFIVLSASGCSCWDGEFNEDSFASLDEVEKFLVHEDVNQYAPTLSGAQTLVAEARETFSKMQRVN